MEKSNSMYKKKNKFSQFIHFDRSSWADLRNSVPLTLTEKDLKPLLGFDEDLSLDEVSIIYLPLVRLINYYIEENMQRRKVLMRFLGKKTKNIPYIIGIAGSVAVGKSTSARIIHSLLKSWPHERKVDLVTTDGFLYPLAELTKKDLLKRKGFPESFDIHSLMNFLCDLKSGKNNLKVPIYSHLTYDIIPDKFTEIDQPEILILEGLNVLQRNKNTSSTFVSDFVDFSIYVDASEDLLKSWYIKRFLKFRQGAFADKNSYFHHYSQMPEHEVIKIAEDIWHNINGLNLKENILPSKNFANLTLSKGYDHKITEVRLKK